MPSKKVFVARQPIFTVSKRVYAYELLFRGTKTDQAQITDGSRATKSVISNTFLNIGIDEVTGHRPAFINFTRDLILDESALLLPPERTIVEILEDIQPDRELIEAVRKTKAKGYIFALDDFVCATGYEGLLQLADIVKVDFLQTSPAERKQLVQRLLAISPTLSLLAEKVEDYDEFQEAVELGFHYFQGYFFNKPILITGRELPGSKVAYLRILQSIHDPTLDYFGLEEVIKTDVSLTTKLLRYINAAAFPWRKKIESLKQALVLLGENQVRKWISIVVLSELVQDKPQELAVLSAVRGRFCEVAGEESNCRATRLECFMTGILSMLDAMLDVTLDEAIVNIPVSTEVKDALKGGENDLGRFLTLAIAYEKGEWDRIPALCSALGIEESKLPAVYADSVEWVSKIF